RRCGSHRLAGRCTTFAPPRLRGAGAGRRAPRRRCRTEGRRPPRRVGGCRAADVAPSVAARLGVRLVQRVARFREVTQFLGDVTLSIGRLIRGRATFQRSDFWVYLQETGVEALGIVSLIAFLIGVILGFVGVIQLEAFGAGIYVANLVAIGMVRAMGPIMTAVLIARG